MATIVGDIIDSMKSIIATELGATYQELKYVYNVEKNNLRSMEKAYGVRPVDAATAESVTKAFTLDHSFEIILTDSVARTDTDVQRTDAIKVMYDKGDEIFKDFINTKIALPLVVLDVRAPSISEPEFVDDNKMVILRFQTVVKYRSNL